MTSSEHSSPDNSIDRRHADIRLLTRQDVAQFRRLRMTMLADTPAAFGSSVQDELALSEADWVARVGPDDDTAVCGAFIGGDLVGSAGLFRQRPAKARHKALIWGVYVDAAARGQGLSRRLMEAMIAHARSLPALRQVTLSVSAWNTTARTLYERLGFVSYGCEPDALYVEGEWIDEVQMMLRLATSR